MTTTPQVETELDLERILQALEADLYVAEGTFTLGSAGAAYDYGLLPDANGNNFGHPYFVYGLPSAPGQTTPNSTPVFDFSSSQWLTYRLRQDEAVLFVGKTPPEVDYFSYRSYLFWRFFPEDSRFKILFASLGDTINNASISLDVQDDDIYDQPVIVLTTANQAVYDRVRAALIAAGVSEKLLNLDAIPLSMVRMGLDNACDQFSFLNRTGNFASVAEGDRYLANHDGESGRVFRLTPKQEIAPQPIASASRLKPRGTGTSNEVDLLPALDRLRASILAIHGESCLATEYKTSLWVFEGYDAIQRGIDAIGENRDTVYLSSEAFPLKLGELAIVYGVNHAATGKATYSSFSVYGERVLNGVAGANSSSADFGGLANELIDDPETAKLFYAWRIGREGDSEGSYLKITYIPPIQDGQRKNAQAIPLEENVFVGFRAYLEPATGVGPAWWELAYDRVIKFTPYGPSPRSSS